MPVIVKSQEEMSQEVACLPLPPGEVATPAFVIIEDAMLHNLQVTAAAAGGIDRLMPHVKTHRAPWIAKWMMEHGVSSFKAATPLEVDMCLNAGAKHVLWAYPTANSANIRKVLDSALNTQDAKVQVLYDCREGLEAWVVELEKTPAKNIHFVLDLDPGMGRTGANIEGDAEALAVEGNQRGKFDGFHLYDGHIQDVDRDIRIEKNRENVARVKELFARMQAHDLVTNLTASGSWSFDLWPEDMAQFVSPGSFIYSSAQHTKELPHLNWKLAAYVLGSVVSARSGSATLDAGSKAISPDMKLSERFFGPGAISAMKEEHSVIQTDQLTVGDKIPLIPRHTCTTAYLFPQALVCHSDGRWEYEDQLGNQR